MSSTYVPLQISRLVPGPDGMFRVIKDPSPLSSKRTIALPQGGTLEVDMTPEFLSRVRAQFSLSSDAPIADDHIRMFVWGAVNSGLTKHQTAVGG
jgi:hypothetical protein